MKKAIIFLGIRPDIIRLSLIIKEMQAHFNVVLVDSSQHYDDNLNKIFYQELNIPEPIRLKTDTSPKGKQLGSIIEKTMEVLEKETPDFCVVLGDNDSSLCFTIATTKLKIPLVHIEAGMRSYNWEMAEEKNRRAIDHLADLNICYLQEHKENLMREGLFERNIFVVGNPIIDVVSLWSEKTKRPDFNKYGSYVLVTLHRGENVDNKDKLQGILIALSKINKNVVMVLMPRTKQKIEEFGFTLPPYVKTIPPQSFLDFLSFEKYADSILTDSGTVVEEAFILGVPCVTIRDSTERVDLIRMGVNILTGTKAEDILKAVESPHAISINPESHYGSWVAEKIATVLRSNWQFWEKR